MRGYGKIGDIEPRLVETYNGGDFGDLYETGNFRVLRTGYCTDIGTPASYDTRSLTRVLPSFLNFNVRKIRAISYQRRIRSLHRTVSSYRRGALILYRTNGLMDPSTTSGIRLLRRTVTSRDMIHDLVFVTSTRALHRLHTRSQLVSRTLASTPRFRRA